MSFKDPVEMFVNLLSHVRATTERSGKIYEELAKVVENDEISEALNARAFARTTELEKIDEAFRLIDKKPVELSGDKQKAFVENFREDLAQIDNPLVRKIFVLSKAIHLAHWRAGEWKVLVAAADFTGNYGVGVLLETCLADDLAFAERTHRILRRMAEAKMAARA
jgi:ferritin-like metal-binding protein YciE